MIMLYVKVLKIPDLKEVCQEQVPYIILSCQGVVKYGRSVH